MIRTLESADYDGWRELWDAYLRFYRATLPATTTAKTFERLVGQADGLVGLLAVGSDGEPLGLAHLVFHPSTWSETSYCYLEDLYVSPAARGTGTGRELIEAAYDEADRRGASSTYWQTQQYNGAARSLYDEVAQPTSFVVYRR